MVMHARAHTHNRAGPWLHARACVGSSTRGRCCGTRHDRYAFETGDGGGAARKGRGVKFRKGEPGRIAANTIDASFARVCARSTREKAAGV